MPRFPVTHRIAPFCPKIADRITNFLENEGTLEVAQRIAGNADSRTTKLYDRRGQRVLLEDSGFGIEPDAESFTQGNKHVAIHAR
jgi:hypothetical protein